MSKVEEERREKTAPRLGVHFDWIGTAEQAKAYKLPEPESLEAIGLYHMWTPEYAESRLVVRPGPYVCLSVADTGVGMAEDVRDRAFEPFFSTREKDRGTGLSTVLGIVRAHDGVIALENDPGWGCTFTVYLRLCPRRARGEA